MSPSRPKPLIVLGTHNPKKGRELVELLSPYGISAQTLAEHAESLQVIEDGETFADNARKKATEQARHLRAWVMGEDSGLCVDPLQGRPGIFSARLAGPDATDEQNNRHLLRLLAEVPCQLRTAHYVCHIAVANPQGEVVIDCEDICRGRIVESPRGDAGFGYDPLFEIIEYHRTFGELGDAVKSLISHRSRALRRVIPQLVRMLAAR